MFAMAPSHTGQDDVNASPRNWIVGVGQFGKFQDGCRLFGDCGVALHAFSTGWKRNQIARVWIRVAILALQTQREMLFVAEGDGLHRRHRSSQIVRHIAYWRQRLRLQLGRHRHSPDHRRQGLSSDY